MREAIAYALSALSLAGCAHVSEKPAAQQTYRGPAEIYTLRYGEVEKMELGVPNAGIVQIRVNRISPEDNLEAVSARRYLFTAKGQTYLKHLFESGRPCAWGLFTTDSTNERDFLAIDKMETLRGTDASTYRNAGDRLYGFGEGLCPPEKNDEMDFGEKTIASR